MIIRERERERETKRHICLNNYLPLNLPTFPSLDFEGRKGREGS